MEVAAFRKLKRNGRRANRYAYIVDEDEFGLWSFTPVRSAVRVADSIGETVSPFPHPPGVLRLTPRDAWWVVSWWPEGEGHVFADTCVPLTFVDDAWTWVDLELDVVRNRAGNVRIDDEDEFADAIAAGLIAPDEQAAARAAADQLVEWFRDHTPPFDDFGWHRTAELAALDLPALDAPLTA